jgi:hypothetical protein
MGRISPRPGDSLCCVPGRQAFTSTRMSMVAIVLFLGVVVSRMDDAKMRLTGVRNFDYRTRNDITVRYEEREASLSHLTALDFCISYFTTGR